MSDNKVKAEQKRLRGRNMHDVVNQLVTEYHAGNGWAVVRVSPNLLNFEVLLERSAKQNVETVNSEVGVVDEKKLEVLVEKETPKPKATAAKKATTTKKVEV